MPQSYKVMKPLENQLAKNKLGRFGQINSNKDAKRIPNKDES